MIDVLYETFYLEEMSNVRGKDVIHPSTLPFSFYFSSNPGTSHSIRVKPSFNPEKLKYSQTGTLKLCDDWEFTPGENDFYISKKEIDNMKQFFKDNIVLFILVWDEFLQDSTVSHYLEGYEPFENVIKDIEFYYDFEHELNKCKSVLDLEKCIRNNLERIHKAGYNVNFYGN